MRPTYLKMSAFGPYAKEVEIPMDRLGEHGLYLITGDTGAGKTTIFDAICFGLFGDASGENREPNMFRSKYADPQTPTEVTLVFLHRGKQYKIIRNPEYERPVKKGLGITKEAASATLYMPDGTIITKTTAVNDAIKQLLGVNKEQFAQIAMLSQGEFLKLLFADTKERQEIFRTLFQTKSYQILQTKLEEARKELIGEVNSLKMANANGIANIVADENDALICQVEKAKAGNMMVEDVLILLKCLIEQDVRQYHELASKIGDINAQQEEINLRIGKAEQIKKARESLVSVSNALVKEKENYQIKKNTADVAKERLLENESLKNKIAAIDADLPQYAEREVLGSKIIQEEALQTKTRQELLHDQETTEKLAGEINQLKEEYATLKEAGVYKERYLGEKKQVKQDLSSLLEIQQELKELKQKEQKMLLALEEFQRDNQEYRKYKSQYDNLEQAYWGGQAGILASTLAEGEMCPVCGSLHHPKPAQQQDNVPSKEELEKAKSYAEEWREKAENGSKKVGVCQNAYEEAKKSLLKRANSILGEQTVIGIDETVDNKIDQKRREDKALSDKIMKEDEKLERKGKLEKVIPKKEEYLLGIQRKIQDTVEKLSTLKGQLEINKDKYHSLNNRLAFPDKQTAVNHRDQIADQVDTIQKSYEHAESQLQAVKQKLNALEGQIQAYEKIIEQDEQIDLDRELDHKTELDVQRDELNVRKEKTGNRYTLNQAAYDQIQKNAKQLQDLEEKMVWVASLADTANGKITGKDKVMLETYIQTTYFQRIVERANYRLLKMSSGQYELMRRKTAENSKSQSGLELDVVDHYNGSQRSVKTLSGGESFMASLSLALGLSDEVQSSAKGIFIDTMFVDEGFGTLDSDTLDQAYRALVSLTEDHRLVGIISHVSELKEKIDKQLIVTKDRSGGSSVALQV